MRTLLHQTIKICSDERNLYKPRGEGFHNYSWIQDFEADFLCKADSP